MFFERQSKKEDVKNPVSDALNKLKKRRALDRDLFNDQCILYLEFALSCGLSSYPVMQSCFDLSATLVDVFQEDAIKRIKWHKARETRLSIDRSPRSIQMKLYPSYFEAILTGIKTFEGRAFDPRSDKDYVDLRHGDEIIFTISQETDGWEDECVRLGLRPEMVMTTQVKDVLFSPTVHGIYQHTRALGREFQPMINGTSELLELQRAAVYYTFPDYSRKISEHGFLGIGLAEQKLID